MVLFRVFYWQVFIDVKERYLRIFKKIFNFKVSMIKKKIKLFRLNNVFIFENLEKVVNHSTLLPTLWNVLHQKVCNLGMEA